MPNAAFYDQNNTYSCISSKHAVFKIWQVFFMQINILMDWQNNGKRF